MEFKELALKSDLDKLNRSWRYIRWFKGPGIISKIQEKKNTYIRQAYGE